MQIKYFEDIIIQKLSKKESKSYKLMSVAGTLIFFVLGIIFVIMALLKNNTEAFLMGAFLLAVAFLSFVMNVYKSIIRRLLRGGNSENIGT